MLCSPLLNGSEKGRKGIRGKRSGCSGDGLCSSRGKRGKRDTVIARPNPVLSPESQECNRPE